jgi:hypothetical protein
MHKNTGLFVTILAIFAALVVGVNIGTKLITKTQTPLPSTVATVNPNLSPTPILLVYSNTMCGFTVKYPVTLTLIDSETGNSAILNNAQDPKQSIAIACQKEIPRPPIAQTRIETVKLSDPAGTSTVSAKLFHDSSPKDGTPIDELIFTNPKNGLDIFIAGYGETYNEIIKTVTLSP